MAVAKVNGVRLFYEVSGAGEVPLAFRARFLGVAPQLGPCRSEIGRVMSGPYLRPARPQ